ncbi:MAG: STAS domain-containing protein [Chloroflexi bacterium]|nr:STAS domain-containing protein [Chloroflexota bacterium]
MSTLDLTEQPFSQLLLSSFSYFARPLDFLRHYNRSFLRFDAVAGLTVAVIALPQAIAYALIAGLPPAMGLYTAVVASIVAALWGSSNQAHSGPTNTHSLLTFSVLITIASPGSPEYVAAAGMLAIMVGLFRLIVGFTRLGMLANFVSDAVVVGFAGGAGILIIINQLSHLLRLQIAAASPLATLWAVALHLPQTHLLSLGLGVGTMIIIILLRRWAPKAPGPLLGIVAALIAVAVWGLDQRGVQVIGELPRVLPPLASLRFSDFTLIGRLSTGALAIGAIGLVQTTSITRSLAAQTGQRLDTNQEFVGQGLANIASGFFSGFVASSSFNRSVVNLEAGARTPLAAALAGVFVLLIMIALGPLAVFIPRAALAGMLLWIGFRMVDRKEMKRLFRGSRGDAVIMISTLLATLFLPLEFAVLTGILMSFGRYIMRTSMPRVLTVLPDETYRHFLPSGHRPQCPQLGVLEIQGDLYFGAANHVEEVILANLQRHPEQSYLLLRMQNVQLIDISGIHMLESVLRTYRERGGDVFFVKVRGQVLERMQTLGFEQGVGEDHFLEEDEAISTIFYHVMDPAVCIYECEVRAFAECQNLPRPDDHLALPTPTGMESETFAMVSPSQLTAELHSPSPPLIIDVREPHEFRSGHIPQAQNVPLPRVLRGQAQLPPDSEIVLVCRTARRSRRAAAALRQQGYQHVHILDGGMTRWGAEQYLQAIDDFDHRGSQPPQGKEES